MLAEILCRDKCLKSLPVTQTVNSIDFFFRSSTSVQNQMLPSRFFAYRDPQEIAEGY